MSGEQESAFSLQKDSRKLQSPEVRSTLRARAAMYGQPTHEEGNNFVCESAPDAPHHRASRASYNSFWDQFTVKANDWFSQKSLMQLSWRAVTTHKAAILELLQLELQGLARLCLLFFKWHRWAVLSFLDLWLLKSFPSRNEQLLNLLHRPPLCLLLSFYLHAA